jgi:hypothetical protein
MTREPGMPVTRASLGRVISGRNMDLEVTFNAVHPQAMLGKSLQVRRARRGHSRSARAIGPPKLPSTPAAPRPRYAYLGSLPARGLACRLA